MKTAIFGFAQSGKSELFAALAGPAAAAQGRAMVKVPEPRLDPLAKLFQPKKLTYAEIEYLDIPGGGGSSGGLGDRVLNEIRPYDCLLAVLDGFSGAADPMAQLQAIEADLMVSDLAVIEKKLEKMGLDKRKSRDLVDAREETALEACRALLEQERPLREDPALAATPELRGYRFLSARPILYAFNVAEKDLDSFTPPPPTTAREHIVVAARLERELAEVEDPEERAAFMEDLGITESALGKVIAATYRMLGLITFLTAGDKEVRAWPVREGAPAPEAAGVIHSDIQKGFIRAQVLGWQDFLDCGDFKTARDRGLLRKEGKDYVVKDGDIIEFFFNV